MVVKEIIVGIITSIFSLISKYLKELLIFSIGFYVGSAFFPSLDYSYIANTPIKEIVSDIKEVPVQTNSGTSIGVVAKKSKDDVDVEIENKGAKIKGVYTKVDGDKIYFDFPTKENEVATKEDGKFVFRQEYSTNIDVTEIVDKLNEEERKRHKEEMKHQKRVERRRVAQHLFWGVIGGVVFEKARDRK